MAEANDYMLKADREQKLAKLEAQRREWQKLRANGKLHYILYNSVFAWGGPLFLAFAAWDLYVLADRAGQIPGKIAVDAGAVGICSLLFGFVEWHFHERRFGDASKEEDAIHRN